MDNDLRSIDLYWFDYDENGDVWGKYRWSEKDDRYILIDSWCSSLHSIEALPEWVPAGYSKDPAKYRSLADLSRSNDI